MEKVDTDRRTRLRSEPSGGKERKVGGGRRRGVHVAAYEIGIVAERGRRTTQEPHDLAASESFLIFPLYER